ncbi:MAG: DUF2283 domain-containing protein [Candidatus Bathyarchaeia archaeon]
MVSGNTTVTFDTEANPMYYKLGAGKVAWSKKSKQNGLDHVIDFNQKEEIIGVEVLDMKRALALAASESMLLLAPVRAIAANQT